MDVGGWLRGLGLGQYEEKFRDNKIDADLLPRLTVDDLKDIGVSVVGDRRRLLDAIAAIAGAGPASPTKSAPSKGLQASAERRPITVMFCDLVGSTSLAAKLDAEDWRSLVNAYLDEASAAVTGLGGHVLKKLGDGLMALFGYPHAQENDAERAVRAALAIQRALSDLNARNPSNGAPELSARIGIECGSVVVDAAGEVFGEAPNVAARVQAAAEPGSVLITGSVQRQVAGLFVVEEKGAHELKSVAQPLSLYRVVRASGGGRKGGARALTPFVGREEDIGTLLRRWDRVRAGEGQFVQIVGEPGLGKSRLVEEFHSRLGVTPHTWVEWNSSQLLQNTPLHPVAEWGRARFGGQDVAPERRVADLETTLAQVKLDVQETATLLAPLLDIPLPAERAPKFGPEELRRRQLAAMVALLLAGARTQPVVLAFEDLHWADPTSLDLIQALAERGAQAPLLVVATTRPEFRAPWVMRSHHAVVALAPLDRTEVRRMVGEIAAQHALPQEVVERVSERTGGVPLFVEEVTRLLVERGEQGGVQAIPPTLQQSLAARLDRLGPAREVAQIGAVLGRDFTYLLLRDVAEADEPTLQASLDRLADADLLFLEGAPPQANYRFKHALIKDAAYDSLLKSRRLALHRRAGEILLDQPARAAAEPEAIAHHFTQAGLDDLAIEWWGKAGDQALRRSAFQEAIAHLGKAIEMADKAAATQPSTVGSVAPNQRLTQLHVAQANALIAARGYTAPETAEAFARARESASGDEDAPGRLAADYGLWASSYVRGDLPSMRAHAAALLRDVEARPDSPEASVAHRAAGLLRWFAGEYREARNHFERALALFQPGRDDDLAFRFGVDPGVNAMAYLAIASWALGEVDRAISLIDRMQTRIAALTHGGTLALGRMHAAMFELMRGEHARAARNAFELVRLTREYDLNMWGAFGVFLQGLAASHAGALADGLEDMRRGAELLREQNVLMFDGLLKIALAEAEARAGDHDRAIAILDEALATCGRTGYRAFEAELRRARGEMLLERDPAALASAEEAFLTAIAVAKQQGTRSFEFRSALSLAKLYQSTGRPAEAHTVLAPTLESFTPTPEMPEIAEAQALLAALAETEEVKSAEGQRQRRLHLQTAYGQAMMWAKGFASEETRAAVLRATELTATADNFVERFAAAHFQWVLAFVRGELRFARELESSFLKEAEDTGRIVEAGVARRDLAMACYGAGDFAEARIHCERALEACDTERDRETQERFRDATGPIVQSVLAVTMWQLGEVDRARELIDEANGLASELCHAPSMAHPLLWKTHLEILRGDAAAALRTAEALENLSLEHGMPFWRTAGALNAAWARGRLHNAAAETEDFRRALVERVDQGTRGVAWFYIGLLAELEAETLGAESALARIEEALALARQVENRCNLAFPHLLRGELLLKRDSSNAASTEEAFRTALDIAQEQGARSWGLRAAFALAKLYQSTGRLVEAHAVLAPAFEGFAPTPEMPEIAEAEALLEALAEMEEVKVAASQQQRQAQLQVAYGNALIAARGPGSPETTDAFAKARGSAFGATDAPERLAADYGLWASSYTRGESPLMRAYAAAFISDVEPRPDSPEAGVAHRAHGVTLHFAGDYLEAREHLERALALFRPGRDDDLAFRFGPDAGVAAMAYLAIVSWPLGEVDHAISHIDRMQTRIAGVSHIGTLAMGRMHAAMFELMRADHARATENAVELARLAREHELPMYGAFGAFLDGWATAQSGAPGGGIEGMRRGVENLHAQNVLVFDGLLKVALAEAETRAGDPGRAIAVLDEALVTVERAGYRAFEAELHRARGEILLKCYPAEPAPTEEAFLTAIAVARQQRTRSFELRAALSLAKLYQSTGRLADAHAVLAPALEGFAPTDGMPEIAEAQALLAALAKMEEVKTAEVSRKRRLQLQADYGLALTFSRGPVAEETKAAVALAKRLADDVGDPAARFRAYQAQFLTSFSGGQIRAARQTAETYLAEARTAVIRYDVAFADILLGQVSMHQGAFAEARAHLVEALDVYDPTWHTEVTSGGVLDLRPYATVVLALACWQLGEVERARELIEQAKASAHEYGNGLILAITYAFVPLLEVFRGDAEAALRGAETLTDVVEKAGNPLYSGSAKAFRSWARAQLNPAADLEEFRQVVVELAEQSQVGMPLFKSLFAELEADGGSTDAALQGIDESLALAKQTAQRWTDSFLHRIRGDILLKADPENPFRAEDAYRAAITIAKQQGARSFGLQASLALAKLYQSTRRPVEAHAVLAPALEGFSPTPEMPEIAEAQALLAALGETEEVKAAITQRRRRLGLQTAYSQAVLWSKGWAASETKTAFERISDLALGAERPGERFPTLYGRSLWSLLRGDVRAARETAEEFLQEAEAEGRPADTGVAHRVLGLACTFQGDLAEARRHLELALEGYVRERDGEVREKFGQDTGVAARIFLAHVLWLSGDLQRSRQLIEEATRLGNELGHLPSTLNTLGYKTFIESIRNDPESVAADAETLFRVSREHGAGVYVALSGVLLSWAQGRLNNARRGADDLRKSLAELAGQGNRAFTPVFHGFLAELETAAGETERALAAIDEGFTTARDGGQHFADAFLHRLRGDILLKRSPADPRPAEEAYRTAIAIAKEQGARSYELLASLSLAKLYRSTSRLAEAQAVLAPALEGFAPTDEMPEIAEAQALLAAIEASAHVRHE